MGVSKLHRVVIRNKRGMMMQPAICRVRQRKAIGGESIQSPFVFFWGFVPFCKSADDERVAWSAMSLFAI
jgi:hypothetical protein